MELSFQSETKYIHYSSVGDKLEGKYSHITTIVVNIVIDDNLFHISLGGQMANILAWCAIYPGLSPVKECLNKCIGDAM